MTNSLYPVTMSDDPEVTADFYAQLLGLERTFTADWYISLAAPGGGPEFATVRRDHASIPDGFAARPGGVLVTVEVDSATEARERAAKLGADIELELRDEQWGQRHFIARDPDGALVDVIEVIPASAEFAAQYAEGAAP